MSKKYFRSLADELVRELQAVTTIKKFADNTAVIGAYSEAIVLKWLQNFFNGNISTGAIISPDLFKAPKNVKQLDHIIWKPSPFPPIFKVDNFALVPANSAYGIVEIKRSNYSGTTSAIERVLQFANKLIAENPRKQELEIEDKRLKKTKIEKMEIVFPDAFSVICLETEKKTKKLITLIEKEKVFILLIKQGNQYIVNTRHVLLLVNKVILLKTAMAKQNAILTKKIIDSFR